VNVPIRAKFPESERGVGNMAKEKKQDKGKISKNILRVTNFPIGDFLIRIKNAALASRHEVSVRQGKFIKGVADVLKREGFLESISSVDDKLVLALAYRDKKPLLINLKLVSKPGVRVYIGRGELQAKKGPSTLILSTSRGVISLKEAIKKGVGGEVIAEIW